MSILIKKANLPPDATNVQISYFTKDKYVTESYPIGNIVEVTSPHGRLIDASEFIKAYMRDTKTGLDDFYDTIDIIDKVPTVVPAED